MIFQCFQKYRYLTSAFERPDFQRLLSDIRESKINCVIVKDLSRFGRNYIESGRYIEKIFPMLGIRFIAVTDGYDSINEDLGSEMIIPFKNLINDAYCRDISVKIRSHMDIKRRNGEYIGAFAAYGYLKDKENKNHLVIDEYAADVVRDIFSMKLCGMSQQAIADKLNADGILSPIQYKKSIGIDLESSFQKSAKPKWSYNAVLRILKNEVYTGTVVQGKCTTPNYKIKKRVHKAENEWIRVQNTHDAIIPRDEFGLVQELLLRDTRVAPDGTEVFPLGGMLFCADCGETMVRKTVPAGGRRYVYYVCSGNKKDKNHCSTHSFSEKKLTESVLEAVKGHIRAVLSISEAVDIISKAPEMKPDAVKCEERIEKLRAEADECNVRRKNLYEDYKDGILTKDEYFMLRDQYQKQLEGIGRSMEAVQSEKDTILSSRSGKQEWIEKLRKYKDADSLDRGLVTFIIDRIDVAEGNRLQVKYRFEKEIQEMERIVELYSRKEAV
ncbi:hypothetical protein IMSAGC007_03844 [Lachnospiraceae bacterium]|nr:hypothetical protein IMSAGC007_03844 [Lachnospiraceae bacterium]